MKYHRLGSSELQVSEICLGTMTFGKQNTEAESHAILTAAIELGINFLDTAEIYPVPVGPDTQGRTEEYIGTWLKSGVVSRNKVIIATKVSGYDTKTTFIPSNRTDPRGAEGPCRLDAKSIRAACLGSLRRLQTDYVDLYQLHWPDRYAPIFGRTWYDDAKNVEREEKDPAVTFEETVKAIGELISEKKIRYWGVCNETTYGVAELVNACRRLGVPPPVSIQNCFNMLYRTFETELAEACASSHYNMGLLPWSVLAGGALTGKYLGEQKPQDSRSMLFPNFQTRFFKSGVASAVRSYVEIADRCNVTPAQLALAWCRSRKFVGATIVGATRVDQLKENVKAFELVLPAQALEDIDNVHRRHPNPVAED